MTMIVRKHFNSPDSCVLLACLMTIPLLLCL